MDEETDPRVVAIGDLRIQRTRRHEKPRDACRHKHMEMDSDGQIVNCLDCGKQLGAYWVLEEMISGYQSACKRVREARAQARQDAAITLHLVAAKQIEAAWKRGMAPCCPFCSRAILPEDGLGSSSVNRQIEIRRRAAEKEAT